MEATPEKQAERLLQIVKAAGLNEQQTTYLCKQICTMHLLQLHQIDKRYFEKYQLHWANTYKLFINN